MHSHRVDDTRMTSSDQAIILAAGQGKRLQPLTDETPKTLLDVGGHAILEHILQCLEMNGYKRAVIVTGFESEQIRAHCRERGSLEIEFVHSERFDSTNNIYSLWLAREYAAGGFTLINSDTLFPSAALAELQRVDGSALLVDPTSERTGEEMLVSFNGTGIDTIGKEITAGDGEYIGVSKFSAADAELLFDHIEAFIERGEVNEWYEAAFDHLFGEADVGIVPIEKPWIEIDTQEDLSQAEELW